MAREVENAPCLCIGNIFKKHFVDMVVSICDNVIG
jgi:hypothetical protein